jgi:hypothetical protein
MRRVQEERVALDLLEPERDVHLAEHVSITAVMICWPCTADI